MNRPHVKICGLKTESDIDAVLARGCSQVGFVHFPPSPRHLALEEMIRLRAHVGGRALVTVVTVDATDEELHRLGERVRPDILQLHGSESPVRVAQIAAITGLSLMKAISVSTREDLAAVAAYRDAANRILLDAKAPKGSALPGGNGVAFDWRLLAGLEGLAQTPFLLSGGLNAGNVADAIRVARPHGLDVSSGVETAPGEKSAALIHRFFDALDAAIHEDADLSLEPERRTA